MLTFEESADQAELVYASDLAPGIRRRRRGGGFSYQLDGGGKVSADERRRIAEIVIPPAWTDVWINPDPRGHILATGRDDAGRKQYRYHPEWERVRDEAKFERLAAFGAALEKLRRQLAVDMGASRMPRGKVVALAVSIMDRTLIRVGSHRYAEENGSFGLTTLTAEHADVNGAGVVFSFPGKGGAELEVEFEDRHLTRLVSQCQELEGQTLFSYLTDTGDVVGIGSDDVNRYLRDVTGGNFTAKDFRSWGASAIVTGELAAAGDGEVAVLAAIDAAATALGNTREVCRSSYVHPGVVEAYESGDLAEIWSRTRTGRHLARPERTLLRVLGDRSARRGGGADVSAHTGR